MTQPRLNRKFLSWQRRINIVLSLLENINSEMHTIPSNDPINKNVCAITKAMLIEINRVLSNYSQWLTDLDSTIQNGGDYKPLFLKYEIQTKNGDNYVDQ